ncbi:MAG: trypsin-like serine protease, partial [Pirellulaceae bacterium]
QIDPSTLDAIQITRAGEDGDLGTSDDVEIAIGSIMVGDPNQNEVQVRFASALPDDRYRIEVFAFDDPSNGITGLRNLDPDGDSGELLVPSDPSARKEQIDFRLNLGPLVEAVVPQPVVRLADGSLQQRRNEVLVHLNNDELFVENDPATGLPTDRSAENPRFYQLLLTQETVRTTDDILYAPDRVIYDAPSNTLRLIFPGDDINKLPGVPLGGGTFRLRVGTAVDQVEELIVEPMRFDIVPQVSSNLGIGADFEITFVAKVFGEEAGSRSIRFIDSGAGGLSVVLEPVSGDVVYDFGGTDPTVEALRNAAQATPDVDTVLSVEFSQGGVAGAGGPLQVPQSLVGSRPLQMVAAGDSLTTATEIGVLGQADSRLTSILISESISPQPFGIQLPGGPNDPGRADSNAASHSDLARGINQRFGPDSNDGITEIAYNFQPIFSGGSGAGSPVQLNNMTAIEKERIREALSLWANYVGVQFLETKESGMTFAVGNRDGLLAASSTELRFVDELNASLRIDPTFEEAAMVFSNEGAFKHNYGEDFFRKAMAGIGFLLGLERNDQLGEQTLMALDPDFLNGTIDPSKIVAPEDAFLPLQTSLQQSINPAIDSQTIDKAVPNALTGSEPAFPGNQDILHGRVLHRPDSIDTDLFRFEVNLDAGREFGTLTAETFAERLPDSSLLDTTLTLFKETSASATTDFRLGAEFSVRIDSLLPGNLGNHSRIEFLQTNRIPGDTEVRVSRVMGEDGQPVANAVRVDVPRAGSSIAPVTVGQVVDALNEDSFASTLFKVTIEFGDRDAGISASVLDRFAPIRLNGGGTVPVVRNDDYFANDSSISAKLSNGVYYLGVAASGNDSYDPAVAGSGFGGRTQGEYELLVKFEPQVSQRDIIRDRDSERTGVPGTPIDGDGDGVPGDVNNFWFQTRPLDRTLQVITDGSGIVPGQTMTITGVGGDVRRFEFVPTGATARPGNVAIPYNPGPSAATPAGALVQAIRTVINSVSSQTGVTASVMTGFAALELSGERSVRLSSDFAGVDVLGRTLFVDKLASISADGSLSQPFNNIASTTLTSAFSSALPDDIVRIVGNGGQDGDLATAHDNFAYQFGVSEVGGKVLPDGRHMEVPKDVTVMIDAGAAFKMRGAAVSVGSGNVLTNRNGAALQVLGTPSLVQLSDPSPVGVSPVDTGVERLNDFGGVIFTSTRDRAVDAAAAGISPAPAAGNWGGIIFRSDFDTAQGRFNLEDEGIFLQTVNHADIRFGGGSNIVINSVQQTVNPVQMVGLRPTISFNRVTDNAGPAMSASPNSFRETRFQAPRFQKAGSFTADYDRIGPDINNNRVVDNSINGLFIRTESIANQSPQEVTVSARFDDVDIVHFIAENIIIAGQPGGPIQDGFAPDFSSVTTQTTVGGSLAADDYQYRMTFVDANGFESLASDATGPVTTTGSARSIRLLNLPVIPNGSDYVMRRLYRLGPSSGEYRLIGQLNRSASTFTDDGSVPGDGAALDLDRPGIRGRLNGSLAIDPNVVVKLRGARIELGQGTQLLAEGLPGQPVIFTSDRDDRYGAGGSFDTNNDAQTPGGGSDPSRGDWSGIYAGPTANVSLDHAVVAYGGGVSPIEGGQSRGFAALELQQASSRVTNSRFEFNDDAAGGSGPIGRNGRLAVTPATIYARFTQPTIVGNEFVDNRGSIIDIDLGSMTDELIADTGRQTGPIDLLVGLSDNHGPLVRGNTTASTPNDVRGLRQLNGMRIRGGELTSGSVWDDTDIAHVMYDSVVVGNQISGGALRLKSRPDQSLVVKLLGGGTPNSATLGTGFTATGSTGDIADRIGGTIHVLGLPGAPVVLTSLKDDSVGAGQRLDGSPQTDTNGDSFGSRPSPNDWRSVYLDSLSNDRNVAALLEEELPTAASPGRNATVNNAQVLGDLAERLTAGDDQLRLGFDVQGFLNSPADVDTYAFTAVAGSRVWIDIDKTSFALDSIVEVVDDAGTVLARSLNSFDEVEDPSQIDVNSPDLLAGALGNRDNPLMKRWESGLYDDFGSTNPRDAGLRLTLPGGSGTRGNYFVRIRSASTDPADRAGGLTDGAYQFQVRLQEQQEFSGSVVRFADIQYANHGIHVQGLPGGSPLLGEVQENESADPFSPETAEDFSFPFAGGYPFEDEPRYPTDIYAENDAINGGRDFLGSGGIFGSTAPLGARPQNVGDLIDSKTGTISIGGSLRDISDIDFFQLDVGRDGSLEDVHRSTVFDVDYADGFDRPDTNLSVFYSPTGNANRARLVLFGANSNILDDRSTPLDTELIGELLARGSKTERDPFIGPVSLPQGSYFIAVTESGRLPEELVSNPRVRRSPIESGVRIFDDHVEVIGGATAAPPREEAFVATTSAGWTITTDRALDFGHQRTGTFEIENRQVALPPDPGNAVGQEDDGIPRGLEASQASVISSGMDEIRPWIVAVDDPNDIIVAPGSGRDGVARLAINRAVGSFLCSGTLLSTGLHVLTAAHCVTDVFGNFDTASASASFETPDGTDTIPVSEFFVHPDWDGNVLQGNDIAILELAASAPDAAERFEIYRDDDEVGQVTEKVGYGLTGVGATGIQLGTSGIRRGGENRFDALADVFDGTFFRPGSVALGTQLAFDFDNGLAANDAFGRIFGINGLGLGDNEINTAPGDSGGPALIDGKVAGVTSYGFGFNIAPDIDPGTNSSFGEMSVDMRVSFYADWIDSVLPSGDPDNASYHFDRSEDNGVLTSNRFDLSGYSAADLPNFYFDYFLDRAVGDSVTVEARSNEQPAPFTLDVQVLDAPNSITWRQGIASLERFAGDTGVVIDFTYDTADPSDDSAEGLFLDNFIVGFAERGEMISDATAGRAGFTETSSGTPGAYQLEVRPGTEYSQSIAGGVLVEKTLAANPQLLDLEWLSFPSGRGIVAYETFSIDVLNLNSGVDETVTFQFRPVEPARQNPSLVDPSAEPIFFSRNDPQTAPGTEPSIVRSVVETIRGLDGYAFFDVRSSNAELFDTFDTNDRHARQVTLVAPAGNQISSGDRFTLGDGSGTLRFEFSDSPNVGVGNIRVPFDPSDSAAIVARRIIEVINSRVVQGSLELKASTASGEWDFNNPQNPAPPPTDARVALHGAVVGNFAAVSKLSDAPAAGTALPLAEDGTLLLSAIFHDGVGDPNTLRTQGQVIIENNQISDVRAIGIWSDTGRRGVDPEDDRSPDVFPGGNNFLQLPPVGNSPLGAALNLPTRNDSVAGGLTPGVTVVNNIIDQAGFSGIKVDGETRPFVIEWNGSSFNYASGNSVLQSRGDILVPDGFMFAIDAGGTRVVFEFEEINGVDTSLGGSGVTGGDGFVDGHVPIYYRLGQGPDRYNPSGPTPIRDTGYSAHEMMMAIYESIQGSALVTNGLVELVRPTLGPSITNPAGPDFRTIGEEPIDFRFGGNVLDFANPAIYLEGVTAIYSSPAFQKQFRSAQLNFSGTFFNSVTGETFNPPAPLAPISEAPQPLAKLVNNTIYGADGTEGAVLADGSLSRAIGLPTDEPNDRIENAVDTKLGVSHRGLYLADGSIGDNSGPLSAEQDVDFFQVELSVGDRLIVDIDTADDGPTTHLRLFDSSGIEVAVGGQGALPPSLKPGSSVEFPRTDDGNPRDGFLDFTALEKDTYYVGVSSAGNDSYEALTLGGRTAGIGGTGDYAIGMEVLAPRSFVLSLDSHPLTPFGAEVASGSLNGTQAQEGTSGVRSLVGTTFTISQIPDYLIPTRPGDAYANVNADGNRVTFEFTAGVNSILLGNGNINVPILTNDFMNGGGYRVPDIMRAISNAISGYLNNPALPNNEVGNGPEGRDGPVSRVTSRALGGSQADNLGIENFIRTTGFPRAPFPGGGFDFTNGFGHDRRESGGTASIVPDGTFTDGSGTTELYVLIENAAKIELSPEAREAGLKLGPDNSRLANGDFRDSEFATESDQLLTEHGILVSSGASAAILNNLVINTHQSIVEEETSVFGFGGRIDSMNPDLNIKPGQVVFTGNAVQYDEQRNTQIRSDVSWWVNAPNVINRNPALDGSLSTDLRTGPSNIDGANSDFNFVVRPEGTPGQSPGNFIIRDFGDLLENAAGDRFTPAANSPAIDSAVDSIRENVDLANLKASVGIPSSFIVAPERDQSGQLRADEPTMAPPGGIGSDVFKDRGALDRADFVGPAASFGSPRDNDVAGGDSDQAVGFIRLTGGIHNEFRILLQDLGSDSNPFVGSGIDDSTVVVGAVDGLRKRGSNFALFEDDRLLREGIDYTFHFNAIENIIVLKPLAGIWKNDRLYRVSLNNRDRFVVAAPSATSTADGDQFLVTDSSGGQLAFEFESGYDLALPETLTLSIPATGTGTGGISDGDRFTLDDGTNPPVTFEFDLADENLVLPSNVRIPFSLGDSREQLAAAVASAIETEVANPDRALDVTVVQQGTKVILGTEAGATLETTNSGLQQAAKTLAFRAPTAGAGSGGIADGEIFTINDGEKSVTFEFEITGGVRAGNVAVPVAGSATAQAVLDRMEAAILSTELNVTPASANNLLILDLPSHGSASLGQGQLRLLGLSRTPADGTTLTFTPTDGGAPTTFELNRAESAVDDGVAAGNIAIDFRRELTADQLAERIAQAINAQTIVGLDTDAVQPTGGGVVSIGGAAGLRLASSDTSRVAVLGQPGVTGATTLQISGPLLLQVPPLGGLAIPDGTQFTIDNNDTSVTFEYNRPFTNPDNPNAVLISVDQNDQAADLATRTALANAHAGLVINATVSPVSPRTVILGDLDAAQVDAAGTPLNIRRGTVSDGEQIIITQRGVRLTFEFDEVASGGGVAPGAIPVPFRATGSLDDVAAALAAAINNNRGNLRLSAVAEAGGVVRLNDVPGTTTNAANAASVTVSGVPGGAIAIRFDRSFTPKQMKQAMLQAINSINPPGEVPVTDLLAEDRGGSTLFVENALLFEGTVDSFFLPAIKDLVGNPLEPNRDDNTTQFTVLMPTLGLDFGDAPDGFDGVSGRYPTMLASDGARHVIRADGPLLGRLVDADPDGQPTPGADGDDTAVRIIDTPTAGATFIATNESGVVEIQIAADPVDGETITLDTGVARATFEFDLDGLFREDNFAVAIQPGETAADAFLRAVAESPLQPAGIEADGNTVRFIVDDEDGVRFNSTGGVFNKNFFTPIDVTFTGTGVLEAWIDFNGDGDWDDPGEQIITR